MKKPAFVLLLIGAATLSTTGVAASAAGIENFIYTSSGDFDSVKWLLNRSDIAGVQIVYNWNLLEPGKDGYDFSLIERHLLDVQSVHKKLFIQIQDRFFSPDARNVPPYLLTEQAYDGGLVPQIDNPGENKPPVQGWVTQQWNPHVRDRFQKLLQALASTFDGRIFGINLPETAIDIDRNHDRTGFTCDAYFQAELENLAFAKKVFQQSYVVQYVNFWPCEWNNDHDYMRRIFEFAATNHVGLGGPDVVPNRKAQMDNSYPFFAKFRGKLRLVAMAVQEPTLTYRNPKTRRPFTKEEFIDFARDYLGANIIFWSPSSPWLRR